MHKRKPGKEHGFKEVLDSMADFVLETAPKGAREATAERRGEKTRIRLTYEKLFKTPDEQLLRAVLDYIHARLRGRYDNQYQIVGRLPKVFQHVYAMMRVQTEVNNGGFDQYFYNSASEFAHEAVDGFEILGVSEYADIMRQAIRVFIRNNPDQKKFAHQGPWRSSKTVRDPEFEQLDAGFYKIRKNLRELCAAFIRKNLKQFAIE